MGRPRTDPKVRFWKNVDKSGECWTWTGGTQKGGYGHFWIDGRHIGAHRQAYIWEHGEIPAGLEPDHVVCDNPPCVRPVHMKLVTHAENIQRAMTKADRSAWKKQHSDKTKCPKGHDYDETNTYIDPRGARRCRACRHV